MQLNEYGWLTGGKRASKLMKCLHIFRRCLYSLLHRLTLAICIFAPFDFVLIWIWIFFFLSLFLSSGWRRSSMPGIGCNYTRAQCRQLTDHHIKCTLRARATCAVPRQRQMNEHIQHIEQSNTFYRFLHAFGIVLAHSIRRPMPMLVFCGFRVRRRERALLR